MAASIIDNGRLCTPDWKDGACRINGPSYFILHWSWYGNFYSTFCFYFPLCLLRCDWYSWLALLHFVGTCGPDKESNCGCWIWEPYGLCDWKGRYSIISVIGFAWQHPTPLSFPPFLLKELKKKGLGKKMCEPPFCFLKLPFSPCYRILSTGNVNWWFFPHQF